MSAGRVYAFLWRRRWLAFLLLGVSFVACYIVFKVCEKVLVERAAAAWKSDT
jgi:hypothetical protein